MLFLNVLFELFKNRDVYFLGNFDDVYLGWSLEIGIVFIIFIRRINREGILKFVGRVLFGFERGGSLFLFLEICFYFVFKNLEFYWFFVFFEGRLDYGFYICVFI